MPSIDRKATHRLDPRLPQKLFEIFIVPESHDSANGATRGRGPASTHGFGAEREHRLQSKGRLRNWGSNVIPLDEDLAQVQTGGISRPDIGVSIMRPLVILRMSTIVLQAGKENSNKLFNHPSSGHDAQGAFKVPAPTSLSSVTVGRMGKHLSAMHHGW